LSRWRSQSARFSTFDVAEGKIYESNSVPNTNAPWINTATNAKPRRNWQRGRNAFTSWRSASSPPEEQARFTHAWSKTQTRFVDEPSRAVREADGMVKEVMQARGYPVGDFEQRAADISVDHPNVVANYRAARDIAQRNNSGKATTEDLRQAMVHYRSLFEELLDTQTPTTRKEAICC
jgi:hypothetical protein